MSDPTRLFDAAELAQASYSSLEFGSTADQFGTLTQLTGAQMSLAQATRFANAYPTVVTQYSDLPTSFSATVFADGDGNLTLAIRGTLEITGTPNDLSADLEIAGQGTAYDQIVAMANWWRRASVSEGMVPQYRLLNLPLGDVPADAVVIRSSADSAFVLLSGASVAATGELVDALAQDPDLRIDVVGHSLGGHLAMAFGTLFSSSTSEVTVFNAPGFVENEANEAFFATLGGAVPNAVNSASVVNVIADEALVGGQPFTPIAGLFSRPGMAIDIAIESQWQSDETKCISGKAFRTGI